MSAEPFSLVDRNTWRYIQKIELFTTNPSKIRQFQHYTPSCRQGRAVAQAVSRQLPTAAARVRARFKSYGIFGGQRGYGTGFLLVLLFLLPIILPIAPHSWTSNGLSNSGLNSTLP
jgi:hypothetical protein